MHFENYHPGILLLYFSTVILCTICFQHPVFLILSFVTSFLCSAWLGTRKSIVIHLCFLPIAILFACYYAVGNHFGVTNLRQNMAGNYMTLESFAYGLSIGIRGASFLMWLSCVHNIMTTDKIVYLFGRISPKLSLYIALFSRLVPRMQEKALQTRESQECIGLGISNGILLDRIKHTFRIGLVVFHFTLEHMKDSSDSMKSRGYSLKGRTAFSIFRFDNRDRTLVIGICFLATLIFTGAALEQNTIVYNPAIMIHKVTPCSILFYTAYLVMGILPMILDTIRDIKKNYKTKYYV